MKNLIAAGADKFGVDKDELDLEHFSLDPSADNEWVDRLSKRLESEKSSLSKALEKMEKSDPKKLLENPEKLLSIKELAPAAKEDKAKEQKKKAEPLPHAPHGGARKGQAKRPERDPEEERAAAARAIADVELLDDSFV